jgi:High-affinity nickel-transport protein
VLTVSQDGQKSRILGIYAVLIVANLAVWAWAFYAFFGQPVMLGAGLLAYSFGLRHAVDADHIAAIDNVTRKTDGQAQSAGCAARRATHGLRRGRSPLPSPPKNRTIALIDGGIRGMWAKPAADQSHRE